MAGRIYPESHIQQAKRNKIDGAAPVAFRSAVPFGSFVVLSSVSCCIALDVRGIANGSPPDACTIARSGGYGADMERISSGYPEGANFGVNTTATISDVYGARAYGF